MQKIYWWLFGIFIVFLFAYGSWQLPFVGPDEPRYSQIARQMLESGDWITPHLGQAIWFEKPVLLYWLIGACFALFGVSELAARLPSLLAAIGAVILAYRFASLAAGRRSAGAAATILGTSAFFVGFSHAATFDMLLTFCITLALFCFYLHELNPADHRSLYCLYIACGLSILAKGFAGVVLIGLTIAVYIAVQQRWRRIIGMKPHIGLLIIVAMTAVWFVPISLIHGQRFWDEFLLQHQLVRYTSSYYHRSGGFFYYVPILLLGTYPWTFAPFLGFRKPLSVQRQLLQRLCYCWFGVTVLFFSFAQSKLPGYVLPAAPPFAILAAFSLTDYLQTQTARRKLIILLLVLNVAVCVALLWGAGKFGVASRSLNFVIATISVITTLTALLFKKNPVYALACYMLIPAAVIIFFVNVLSNELHWKDAKSLASRLQSRWSDSDKLAVYNVYNFGLVFYTNGRVELTPEGYLYTIRDYPSLHRYVVQQNTAFVVVANEELQWIRGADFWRVVDVISGTDISIVQLHARR